jgi:hypothetical protein
VIDFTLFFPVKLGTAPETVQPPVEEQQIEREIALPHLERVLGAHEAEIAAHLDQEISQPVDQPAVQIALRVMGRQVEELDHVGVLEDAERVGVRLCQRC